MAEFTTTWHRFNSVVSQNDANNASDLIGTTEGTASLDVVSAAQITIGTPTIIDNSGTQLNFSDEIPSNAVLTNYQVSSFISASVTNIQQLLDVNVNGTGITETLIAATNPLSLFPYSIKYPTDSDSTTQFSVSGPNITLSNIDNFQLKYLYDDASPNGNWYFLSGDFDNPVPYPAVRFIYELPPKLTITTGKLSITGNNKVNIV